MTYSPATLRLLGAYWTEHGGVNLGIVGDTNHTAGYHLGRDRIYSPSGQGDADYSVKHPRDKAGLSDAAAGIDLGRVNGSLTGLQHFSRWLVRQCQNGADGSRDVREVIYSPDGSQVQRWSGIDGGIHTGPGNGDLSHLSHTHISYFRDSEDRDKVALFAPYWEDEDVVDWYPLPGGDGTVTIKEGRGLVSLVTGKAVGTTDYEKVSHCRGHLVEPFGAGANRQEGYVVRHRQQAMLALDDVVESFTPRDDGTAPAPSLSVLTGDDGSVFTRS